jgi:hypothetical protein
MHKITEEQLKAGLSAIKFRYANLRQRDQRTPIRATQREALAKLFRHGIEGRRKALEQSATLTNVITLPTSILISTTRYLPDGSTEASPILIDSHLEPLNNWAKIILNYAGDTPLGGVIDVLYFYFQWQNETGSAAIVNVRSDVWLNGSCYVHANYDLGSYHPNVVNVDTVLHPLEWWNQPPTEPLYESGQSKTAVWLGVSSGNFSGEGKSELISAGYSLTYNNFLIPRNAVGVFEVGVRLFYILHNGKVNVDFAFDDQSVLCPYLQLDVSPLKVLKEQPN